MSRDQSDTTARSFRWVKPPEWIEKGVPADGSRYLLDWRSYDIPETVARGIRNAAPGLVAVTLSMFGGQKMIAAAEKAAKERGVRVLWWFGPSMHDLPESGRAYLRQCVAEARASA